MMHRYCFEALDRTLRDILIFKDASNLDRPFGEKMVVLGGDFRQILPVIPKAIGDGMIGNSIDGIEKVYIPDDLIKNNCGDPISAIVESTYPNFLSHCNDITCLQQRGILAPTLDMVESINEHMVSLNQSQPKTLLSSDTICMSDDAFTVFTHGQLYVALSRVTNRKGLRILVYDDDGKISNEATNVVYKEVFHIYLENESKFDLKVHNLCASRPPVFSKPYWK
ncbi:uncharacterized protein [Nicotiana tomentosiformis]|uniref:uncharacterized protein n=1 Tax=Nicotiana tomentosiformis TaxID=4098 RepID=UPI00388C37D3